MEYGDVYFVEDGVTVYHAWGTAMDDRDNCMLCNHQITSGHVASRGVRYAFGIVCAGHKPPKTIPVSTWAGKASKG